MNKDEKLISFLDEWKKDVDETRRENIIKIIDKILDKYKED